MLNSFTYTGRGHWGQWVTLSAFTRRVEIEVIASVPVEGNLQTYLSARARVFDNSNVHKVITFSTSNEGRLEFTFQAGFDNSDVPEMHGPAIKFLAPRGAQIAVTWRETSWRPISRRLNSRAPLKQTAFGKWIKTGKK